jgi:hypothetical protein
MHLVTAPYTPGTNMEDANIYTLTFEGKERESAREVQAAAALAVIA